MTALKQKKTKAEQPKATVKLARPVQNGSHRRYRTLC
jgi:hypothetical protein